MSGAWEARIRRADRLAFLYPFAAEVLGLYRHIAEFQRDLQNAIRSAAGLRVPALSPHSFRDAFDMNAVLPHFPKLLALVQRCAPAPLSATARELLEREPGTWDALLTAFLFTGSLGDRPIDPLEAFCPSAFLQPYAEFLASRAEMPQTEAAPRVCPLCASAPLIGVLRQEGDGGKRFLLCSFCSREWEFRRILCPSCGEENETKLPVYTAEQFPHIRVEACDTCKSYVRSINLTKDGNAIPIVDDLAAIPLSLWAHEHTYTRIHPNLFST